MLCIAASAGGLRALQAVLASLAAPFDASVVVVQHLAPDHPSLLAEILGAATELPVRQVRDGDELVGGIVLVAPPGHHVAIGPNRTLALVDSPRRHFVRPSADVLFESAAAVAGADAVGVVLTGTGVDGAEGVCAIHEAGGTVLVQDPALAEYEGMPAAAVATGVVDEIVPLHELGPRLVELVRGGADR